MSEKRSLAVVEILAHLSDVLPDKDVLGSADIPDDIAPELLPELLNDRDLPGKWETLEVAGQGAMRRLGDEWLTSESHATGPNVFAERPGETRGHAI